MRVYLLNSMVCGTQQVITICHYFVICLSALECKLHMDRDSVLSHGVFPPPVAVAGTCKCSELDKMGGWMRDGD